MGDEIQGLQNIIGDSSTLHGIEAPPERDEFATDDEFEKALEAYHARVTYWHTERKDEPDA